MATAQRPIRPAADVAHPSAARRALSASAPTPDTPAGCRSGARWPRRSSRSSPRPPHRQREALLRRPGPLAQQLVLHRQLPNVSLRHIERRRAGRRAAHRLVYPFDPFKRAPPSPTSGGHTRHIAGAPCARALRWPRRRAGNETPSASAQSLQVGPARFFCRKTRLEIGLMACKYQVYHQTRDGGPQRHR